MNRADSGYELADMVFYGSPSHMGLLRTLRGLACLPLSTHSVPGTVPRAPYIRTHFIVTTNLQDKANTAVIPAHRCGTRPRKGRQFARDDTGGKRERERLNPHSLAPEPHS